MIATLGEILLRFSPPNSGIIGRLNLYESHVGGSESNIAVNLSSWNKPVRLISAVADNELSEGILHYYKGLGIDTHFIQQKAGRNGLYFLENGWAYRAPKIIYDRENSVFNQLAPNEIDWDNAFKNVIWFHWSGITPALSENARLLCEKAIDYATEHDVFISTDLNIRKKLWKYGKGPKDVMPALLQKTNGLLGDPFAFQELFDSHYALDIDYFTDVQSAKDVFSILSENLPVLQFWAMTLRKVHNASYHSISGLLYSHGFVHKARTYEVQPIIGRVGGGDAFMSGLINYKFSGKTDPETIEFATAGAVLKSSIPGDVLELKEEDVEDLILNKQKIRR